MANSQDSSAAALFSARLASATQDMIDSLKESQQQRSEPAEMQPTQEQRIQASSGTQQDDSSDEGDCGNMAGNAATVVSANYSSGTNTARISRAADKVDKASSTAAASAESSKDKDKDKNKTLHKESAKETNQVISPDSAAQTDRLSLDWIQKYIELQQYHSQHHGDCNRVPTKGPLKNKKLAKWVSKQKREYSKWRLQQEQQQQIQQGAKDDNSNSNLTLDPSEMTEERIRLLENIGLEWEEDHSANCTAAGRNRNYKPSSLTDPAPKRIKDHHHRNSNSVHQSKSSEDWNQRYNDLLQFQSEFGHTRVPLSYPANLPLGLWVTEQRKQYKLLQRGKAGSRRQQQGQGHHHNLPTMTTHHIQLLEQIGFKWREDPEWKKRYQELQLFKSRFGHCNVTAAVASSALAQWAREQRGQKQLFDEGKASNMTLERVQMMEGVGFHWSEDDEDNHDDEVAVVINGSSDSNQVVATSLEAATAQEASQEASNNCLHNKRKFISSRKRLSKSESSSSETSEHPSTTSGSHLPERIRFHVNQQEQLSGGVSELGGAGSGSGSGSDPSGDNDDSDRNAKKLKMDEEGCYNGEVSRLLISSQSNLALSLEQKYSTKNEEQKTPIASSVVAPANNAPATNFSQESSMLEQQLKDVINEINKNSGGQASTNNDQPARNGPTINSSSHSMNSMLLQQLLGSDNFVQSSFPAPSSQGNTNTLFGSSQLAGFQFPNSYQQAMQRQAQLQALQAKAQQAALNSQLVNALQIMMASQHQQNQNQANPMHSQVQQLGLAQQTPSAAAAHAVAAPSSLETAQPSCATATLVANTISSEPASKPAAAPLVRKKSRSSTGRGENWFRRYNELKAYKSQHGNCNVPKRYTENSGLGTWVSNQRSLRRLLLEGKPSHMTPERMNMLEEVGFEWHPPTGPNAKQEEQWNQRCRELEKYRDEHGHCRVPTKNYLPNPALGQWVNDQRRQYRHMKQGFASSMTTNRMNTLEEIGFEWYSAPPSRKST